LRLFLYKAVTQTIIILGVLRQKLGGKKNHLQDVIRRDHTFKNPDDQFFSIECCDCGLIHFRIAERGLEQPIRPTDYDYTWRRFAPKSSEFKHESEWGST